MVDRSTEQARGYENGYFVGPTVLTDVEVSSPAYQDELFGPVLAVLRVDTLDDALQLIENHRYGNGAPDFTRDGVAANEFERRASAGMIGINVANPVAVAGLCRTGMEGVRLRRHRTEQRVLEILYTPGIRRFPLGKHHRRRLRFPPELTASTLMPMNPGPSDQRCFR